MIGRDRDEELGREQAVGERITHERPIALRRIPDGDRADDEDRRGGPPGTEAQRRPQKHREDDVGHVALRRQLRQHHEQNQRKRALEDFAPANTLQATGRPRQQRRRDHQHARRVAQDPRTKDAPELARLDHIAQAQRQRPDGPADHRCKQRARQQGHDVRDALQFAPPARQPAQQQRSNDKRERVPDRLGHNRPQRRREVPKQQIADHDSGPEPNPTQKQHGQAEPGRRPKRRDRAIEIGQFEADPSRQVVGQREQRHRAHVQRQTPAPRPAQRHDPLAHVAAVSHRTGDRRYAHALEPSLIPPAGRCDPVQTRHHLPRATVQPRAPDLLSRVRRLAAAGSGQ